MDESDIKIELSEMLKRQGMKQRDLASDLHVQEATVSNWIKSKNHNIPIDKLILISKSYSDLRFKRAVGDYLTEMPDIERQFNLYGDELPSLFMGAKAEESDREAMDNEAQRIISKRPDLRTEQDRNFIVRYLKEFVQENSTEGGFIDKLQQEFNINPLEMEMAK